MVELTLKDLRGRTAYITEDWPFDICGILDDGRYFKISQHQQSWDGNEMTVRVGTKQIDLRELWHGDLHLCGYVDRPSDEILTIEGLVKFFFAKLGLKLIPDDALTFVYQKTTIPDKEKRKLHKRITQKYLRKFGNYRGKFGGLNVPDEESKAIEAELNAIEMSERKRKMVQYRFEKFGIDPSSDLNKFDMTN